MDVIFIIGCSPRSGTNYVFNILREHPDTVHPTIKNEDFLLVNSNYIRNYIELTKKLYPHNWGNDHIDFGATIGKALKSLLYSQSFDNKKVITKTPMPLNIQNFDLLFKGEKLVIIVRNGPDTIDSYMKTFKKSFEFSIRVWKSGMQTLTNFKPQVFKYESFIDNKKYTISKLLNYCDLDESKYSYDAAERIGIVGSSKYTIDGKISWEKEIEINDTTIKDVAWEKWGLIKKWRYVYLCRDVDKEFDYVNEIHISGLIYPFFLIANYYLNGLFLIQRIYNKITR